MDKNTEVVNELEKIRHYTANPLPVLPEGTTKHPHEDSLLKLYSEICSSWRMLTDIRFKLLGLVPTLSGAMLITLLSRSSAIAGLSPIVRIGIAFFGLAITFGIMIYNQRNSQLYNDLISRGRRIEYELGIHTGLFRGRLKPKNRIVNHGMGTNLVYVTTIAGWIFALIATLGNWIQ